MEVVAVVVVVVVEEVVEEVVVEGETEEEERGILGELFVEVVTVVGHSCVSVVFMPAKPSVSVRSSEPIGIQEYAKTRTYYIIFLLCEPTATED